MKVILLGASGMVGQGVLRECLLDPEVEKILSIVRRPSGQRSPKLRELMPKDLFDLSPIAAQFAGFDACFFCLGVSSVGMAPEEYRRVTYDLTLSVAQTLVKESPQMTFVYVSGTGTDSSETKKSWAAVKGATENALLRLPFKAAYMFRPGYIQPLHGIVPKTKWLKGVYAVMAPLYPLWKALAPSYVTTTEAVGRAMLQVVRQTPATKFLENRDINALAARL